MSQAIETLRHEHEAILLALQILGQIAAKAKQGDISSQDAVDFLGFLREFADKCHHGKEEGLLFPAMVNAGLPSDGGPIAVMLTEHARGRYLVAAMADAVEPDIKLVEFAAAASSYVDHLKAHIEKENNVLFPMAESILAADTMARLAPAFERHEEEVIGHGRHEELHHMLRHLKTKYLDS